MNKIYMKVCIRKGNEFMDLKNNQITLGDVIKNKEAFELIQNEFGSIMKGPLFAVAKKMSLEKIIAYSDGKISKNKIEELLLKLKNV